MLGTRFSQKRVLNLIRRRHTLQHLLHACLLGAHAAIPTGSTIRPRKIGIQQETRILKEDARNAENVMNPTYRNYYKKY